MCDCQVASSGSRAGAMSKRHPCIKNGRASTRRPNLRLLISIAASQRLSHAATLDDGALDRCLYKLFLGDVYMERVRYKDIGDRPFDLGSLERPATPLIEVSRRDTGWRLDIRRLEGIDGEEMVRREVALFGKSPGDGECGPKSIGIRRDLLARFAWLDWLSLVLRTKDKSNDLAEECRI